jgi:undecaprenyl-phosphate 4-deoxy-4-formamido-L-arabinose transferase
MPSLSIVIPVYRSASILPKLLAELDDTLPAITHTFEVILVEDNGGDDSWQVIQQQQTRYHWLRGIKLMRNFGQHNALLCGIRAARHEVVITMDDDMQHPPAEIPILLEKLDAGAEVVYGFAASKQHDVGRNLGSGLVRLSLSTVMGVNNARYVSAFRAFRTYLRDAFANYDSPNVSLDVLLSWGTRRFEVVFVEHRLRAEGQSTYNLRKLVGLALTMLTGFSALPLRLASYLGFVLTIFGFVLLIYVIPVRLWILGFDVPGFTFLASVVSLFSGVQMFTIGIIGEYLARMHFRLMNKPPYVVREQNKSETI